jgi:hypothetical protein
VLELGQFGKYIRNTWKVLKCGAGKHGRMEKISWTDCVRNEEMLHRVKEERNIIHTIKIRKGNWTGQILRGNCRLEIHY